MEGPREIGVIVIHGNPARGTGILTNELYVGRLVWTACDTSRTRSRGGGVSRPNPPGAWITTESSELRIVPQEL